MTNTKQLQLTDDALAKLQAQLEEHKTTIRAQIAEEIDTARRYGDLSENSAYKSALEKRTMNEVKIEELEDMISRSVIVEEAPKGEVGIGSEVTVEIDGREMVYKIVSATEADPAVLAVSNESPIGAALMGKKKGHEVEIELPAGNKTMKIVSIK